MLTLRDRRLLLELDRNSRASVAALARAIRSPVETVRYRLHHLVDEGYIQNFLTVVDGGRLGFYYYKIFLRFHNVNERRVGEVLRFLHAKENVTWIVRTDGSWDVGFTVNVRNPIELSVLIDEIRARFSRLIRRWIYSVNIRMDLLTRDYLVNGRRGGKEAGSYSALKEPYALDNVDREIIRRLGGDARVQASDIARGIPMTAEGVLGRIRKLTREGIIVRYTLVLNNAKLGQLNFYVLVTLSSATPKEEQSFVDYCKKKANIVYIIKALGEWDYELSIEVGTVEEYRGLMMDLTEAFSDIIADYNGMNVIAIRKYVYP